MMPEVFEARINGDSLRLHWVKEMKGVVNAIIAPKEVNETVNCWQF
jgi:hypothetical protein